LDERSDHHGLNNYCDQHVGLILMSQPHQKVPRSRVERESKRQLGKFGNAKSYLVGTGTFLSDLREGKLEKPKFERG
jgi:hypothetical protein